ncbi:DUF92 domain-containing protein [Abyssisolibacter fermentans]|uniref:DUF92 domain-containing protein n=1 Tax=Abyssisolibacter fermentans TaxID=1766203 RepID=UPI000833EE1A|nr:DUF92 domain-containing protein [Abyssisolibacter fermentans]
MNDLLGVVLSITFVFVILIVSEVLKKTCKWSNESTRKFVHIGVAHWWVVAMYSIESIYYAIIPPIIFVILNYVSYKKQLIKSMERNGNKADLGTVYFPISLVILIALFWKNGLLGSDYRYIGAIGILVMGYGDGFAAIVGKKFGNIKYFIFGNEKSIEGSFTVFILSFIVSALILFNYKGIDIIHIAIIVAFLATIIEAITPWGLDNLTVPISSSLIVYYLLNIQSVHIELFTSLSLGFLISSSVAFPAYYKKSLKLSGCIGAIILGTIIFMTSGVLGIVIMLSFFISSSLLSHFKKNRKQECAKLFDKTGNRDILQVFANGGVGLIYSIIYHFSHNIIHLICICIAFAASNADTWATELGVLNKTKPFSLRTFKRVNKGTSGAISLLGTFSSFIGSVFIALVSIFLIIYMNVDIGNLSILKIFILISLGGFFGGLIDSFLGATVQGVYYSEEEDKETEKKIFNGKKTTLIRGFEMFNNDLVNFLSIGLSSILILSIVG